MNDYEYIKSKLNSKEELIALDNKVIWAMDEVLKRGYEFCGYIYEHMSNIYDSVTFAKNRDLLTEDPSSLESADGWVVVEYFDDGLTADYHTGHISLISNAVSDTNVDIQDVADMMDDSEDEFESDNTVNVVHMVDRDHTYKWLTLNLEIDITDLSVLQERAMGLMRIIGILDGEITNRTP